MKDIDDSGIYFPDHVFTQNRICKKKKGICVCFIVKTCYNVEIVKHCTYIKEDIIDILTIKINKYYITVMYSSPESNVQFCNDTINTILPRLLNVN